MYRLEYGPHEKDYFELAKQDGYRSLPAPMKNPPRLAEGLELYFNAWWELDSCRPTGFGPGRIPWTAVQEFGTLQELDQDQLQSLHFHIGQMDRAYLEWHAEQHKDPK